MTKRKPVAFFILGAFGIGKTSLVNFRPHDETLKEVSFVDGMASPGGARGTDSLNGYGFKKKDFYERIMPSIVRHDIIFHGVFYSSYKDLEALSKTHDVVCIWLDTTEYNCMSRIGMRGGKFNSDTFQSISKKKDRYKAVCEKLGLEYHVLDNNRPFELVAAQLWSFISHRRNI